MEFFREGLRSDFPRQSEGCDLMQVLECLASVPLSTTVANVSLELKFTNKLTTGFQHITSHHKTTPCYCCVFITDIFSSNRVIWGEKRICVTLLVIKVVLLDFVLML